MRTGHGQKAGTALLAAIIAAGLATAAGAQSQAPGSVAPPGEAPHGIGPIETLGELAPALTRCWQPPPGTRGHAVTVRFSLKRDGSLNGEPRITHSELPGDDATGRLFVASVLAALAQCLPAPITDGLGGAIAGRPFTLRFVAGQAPELRA